MRWRPTWEGEGPCGPAQKPGFQGRGEHRVIFKPTCSVTQVLDRCLWQWHILLGWFLRLTQGN